MENLRPPFPIPDSQFPILACPLGRRWARVCLTGPSEASESLSSLLFASGCLGVEVVDFSAEAFMKEERPRVSLVGYVPADHRLKPWLSALRAAAKSCVRTFSPGDRVSLSVSSVDEEDWAEAWKAHFHSMPVGNRLLIRPSWELPEDASGRITITLDPGMAFGTGTHPSTRLALVALEEHSRPGMRVADVGCGSGILAIVAAKLGADRVVAVDDDPLAARVAGENTRANDVADRVLVVVGHLLEPLGGRFDLVVANISGPAVASLASSATERLRPDGILVGSGWTRPHHAPVEKAFRQAGLSIRDHPVEEEWCGLVGQA